MKGISISVLCTFIVYSIFRTIGLDPDSALFNGYIVGPAEELFKMFPVILMAYFLHKNRGIMPNLSDFLLMAVLSGTAFSMVEKVFWDGIYFPFTYGPGVGPWHFFPDALGIYVSGEAFGYIGHAAASGLVGMGIGLSLLAKGQKHALLKKLWGIPALATFIWIALEHALLNAYYADGTELLLAIGGGQVTPFIFLALLVTVLVLDGRRLISGMKNEKEFGKNVKITLKRFWQEFKNPSQSRLTTFILFTSYIRKANSFVWLPISKQISINLKMK